MYCPDNAYIDIITPVFNLSIHFKLYSLLIRIGDVSCKCKRLTFLEEENDNVSKKRILVSSW